MAYIRFFRELSKNDVGAAGGKGASLGEMSQAGIPVPPGFVVCANAFDAFLHETDLAQEIEAQLDRVNPHDVATVDRASETIRALILQAEMPKDIGDEITASFSELGAEFVAVRSSATAEDSSAASWAGELESYLNTTEGDLLDRVKKCWSSLFTPRAIVYRHEKEMHRSYVAVAVVVQKMVQSEVAGICFTVHPVTQDRDQMIIEACWGLGEYIVGGVVTPDSYVIDKRDDTLLDVNVSDQEVMLTRHEHGNKEIAVPTDKKSKQKITTAQIKELADICTRIEKHYGFPCDIEWAFESGTFSIVQSRPITTL